MGKTSPQGQCPALGPTAWQGPSTAAGSGRPFGGARGHLGGGAIERLGQKLFSQITAAAGVRWELEPLLLRQEGPLQEARALRGEERSGGGHVADTVTPPHDIADWPPNIHPSSAERGSPACATMHLPCDLGRAPFLCTLALPVKWANPAAPLVGRSGSQVTSRHGRPTAARLLTTANIPPGLLGARGARGARGRDDSEHPPQGRSQGWGRIRWWEGKRM